MADPEKALSLSPNKGRGGLGGQGVKASLLPLTEVSPVIAHALETIPECQIFERSIVGRYPAESWRSPGGRLALVGDSATAMHPKCGQGANTAFTDAAAAIDAIVNVVTGQEDMDWKAALERFERLRKPTSDLVQLFCNVMGVVQATGNSSIISPAKMEEMMHWIRLADPTLKPPADVVRVIRTFDPCGFPGVRPLW